MRWPGPIPSNLKGHSYCAFYDMMSHHTGDCRSLQKQFQELFNRDTLGVHP